MDLLKTLSGIVLAIMLALPLSTSAARAQNETERSFYDQAEDYRLGRAGVTDLDKALALHKLSAENGRELSLIRMASIYLLRDQHQEALDALSLAKDRGQAYGRRLWAGNHLNGKFGTLSDPAVGFSEMKAIVEETQNQTAMYLLARAYEFGMGTERDIPRAIDMYEALAEDEDHNALRRLADISLNGTYGKPDRETAIALYEKAAEAGNKIALRSLARAYLVEGDIDASIATFQKATAGEDTRAASEYAKNHFLQEFGPSSDKNFGATWIENEAEAGNVEAAITAIQLWERRSRRISSLDLDAVLDVLKNAADSGNRRAAEGLARAYRVLRWKIPNARSKHKELLETHGDIMGPRSYHRERFFAVYDPDNHRQSYRESTDYVRALNADEFAQGAMGLRSTERTAFVHLVQAELKDLGLYSGPINGRMTASTTRAMLRFCRQIDVYDVCIHGPLLYSSSAEIAKGLAETRKR